MNASKYKITSIILVLGLVLIVSAFIFFRKDKAASNPSTAVQETNAVKPKVAQPMEKTDQRVTKKPFGILISPKSSPVSPEKFSGYHVGTDFEIISGEEKTDVPFFAICEGRILQKRTATGYGGLLVQSCTIDGQAVTVVYGHVKLSSIAKDYPNNLTAGEKIGVLGQPPKDTDSERKHLHLGIHKGTNIDIRGYVQNESELTNWFDFQKL
jgi:hypothetical protein